MSSIQTLQILQPAQIISALRVAEPALKHSLCVLAVMGVVDYALSGLNSSERPH